jgi:hypothetical protein
LIEALEQSQEQVIVTPVEDIQVVTASKRKSAKINVQIPKSKRISKKKREIESKEEAEKPKSK